MHRVAMRVDLEIEQFDKPLPVDAVFAEGRCLARRHRLEEIGGICAAVLVAMRRIEMVLAQCRPGKASRRKVCDLTATPRFRPGACRWIDYKSDGLGATSS